MEQEHVILVALTPTVQHCLPSQRSVKISRFNRCKSSIRKRARFLSSGMGGIQGRNHVALHIRSLR